VTTPFSDDSLLPKPAPAMPASPDGLQYVLRSERTQWDRRASVATETAATLDSAIFDLNEVADRNVFGNCIEGTGFHNALVAVVNQLISNIDDCSRQAVALAQQCRHAGQAIAAADGNGAAVLDT